MPWPIETTVEVVGPEKYSLRVKEPVLPEDPDSGDQTPLYNAYSGDGNVTGEVVYVNYGMPADYDKLKELGVDVKGKIVIARYGAGWRGIKPKVAYEHGAIGCLIYSDPRDDGYYAGDVYPGRPVSPGVRRAARQRDGHAGARRRSADARMGQRARRQEEPHRGFADDPEDPGAADFVRRCGADPAAAQRQGRAERMEGRAAVHVSRRSRSRAGAHEPAVRVEEPPALQRRRAHSRHDAAGRVDHLRQSPRCVGERRRRSDQRRGVADGNGARPRRTAEDRLAPVAHDHPRVVGRRRVGPARIDRVGGEARRRAEAEGRGLHQHRRHRQRLAEHRRLARPAAVHERGREGRERSAHRQAGVRGSAPPRGPRRAGSRSQGGGSRSVAAAGAARIGIRLHAVPAAPDACRR